MRKLLPLLLLPLLAAPLAGQEFEGSIAMKMTGKDLPEPMTMTFYVGGGRQAMVMAMPSGPMAGKEVRMVINPATSKMTMLMPMPPGMPGNGKGMKTVMDFGKMADQAESKAGTATVKALGTSQQVAGMKCDDYQVTTKDETINLCMTDKLGRYAFPDMAGRGRPQLPEWTAAFGDKNVFPLKVWKDDGSMTMEVLSVKRGPVDAAILDDSPEGYMAMPGMGG